MGYREKAYELAKSIMNTEEYKRFLNAKEIDSTNNLAKGVGVFKKAGGDFYDKRPANPERKTFAAQQGVFKSFKRPACRTLFRRG